MTNEHNPIAQLISKLQQQWTEDIVPFADVRLVRWLIEPEQSQLYEGFLKIESSQHGKLPDIFVVLLTPFESADSYSSNLAKCWFEAMEKDNKVFEQLDVQGNKFNWNQEYFEKKFKSGINKTNELLLEMLKSFHTALNMPERHLTVALFPYNISSIKEYEDWLKSILNADIPEKIRFCIFDLSEQRFYDKLFASCNPEYVKTIHTDLDLDGAINKVISAGNPNDPGVRLQRYTQQMSAAVSAGNKEKLKQIGDACIKDMNSAKSKALLATAYITYAGMLFNFKQYDIIEMLLDKGLKVAELGKLAEDAICKSLVQQFYSFKAASYQLGKKHKEAIVCYLKSADLALEQAQALPAITSYRQAAFLAKKFQPENYPSILARGFDSGKSTEKENLRFSEYGFLGFEYYTYLHFEGNDQRKEEIDETLKIIFGENWKDEIEEQLASQNKKAAA